MHVNRTAFLVVIALVAALLAFSPDPGRDASADTAPVFLTKWGSEGTGDGQLLYPSGIAADAAGNVYVVDRSNTRIEKFSSAGVFLAKWGSYGTGDGEFQDPEDVTVDAAGNVYVVDRSNHRIQKFSAAGVFLTKWGSEGSGDGELEYPTGIAADAAGNIYVVDESNQRIEKFSNAGVFLTKWGTYGTGDGEFQFPHDVAADAAGNVYVVDRSNHRIQKFSDAGVFLTKWGSEGSGDGEFEYPTGIAADAVGNVYIVDESNQRIRKFSSDGDFLTQWGSYGTGDGEFQFPHDVAIDASGNVYVVDTSNHRIQVFGAPPPAPPTPAECIHLEPFDNIIVGTESNVPINGTALKDLIFGVGADLLRRSDSDDCMVGGEGDDVLLTGLDNDVLIGGPGADTVGFPGELPVTASLQTGIATRGPYTKTLFEIENLAGSGLDDVLIGDGGDNILQGNAGNDFIDGVSGANDSAIGGDGVDVCINVDSQSECENLEAESASAAPGVSSEAAVPPDEAGEAGIVATASNNTPSSGDLTVVVATFGENPTGEPLFDAGAFVDLRVIGADESDTVEASIYYPSTVSGPAEDALELRYFDGQEWVLVKSSGGADPAKSTSDDLDETVSGGRFSVTFDNTSTPQVTELTGTVFAATAPEQSAEARILYLHGTGPNANPPTLFLDTSAPTAGTAKYRDSAGVNFNGGNAWTDVGSWAASAAVSQGTLTSLQQTTVWLGLKNSDDQGTSFDLRVEFYKNGSLLATGLQRCVTGITRNANQSKEVSVALPQTDPATFNGSSDALSVKVSTRIGTNANDTKCAGHNNATGLRVYFDAVDRSAALVVGYQP